MLEKQGIYGGDRIHIRTEETLRHVRSMRDYFVSFVLETIETIGDNNIRGRARKRPHPQENTWTIFCFAQICIFVYWQRRECDIFEDPSFSMDPGGSFEACDDISTINWLTARHQISSKPNSSVFPPDNNLNDEKKVIQRSYYAEQKSRISRHQGAPISRLEQTDAEHNVRQSSAATNMINPFIPSGFLKFMLTCFSEFQLLPGTNLPQHLALPFYMLHCMQITALLS